MIDSLIAEMVAVVVAVLAVLHVVSVEMRLADVTRRLESAERSLDRLCRVWWEGVARRNGIAVEHGDDPWDEKTPSD